MTLCLKKDKLLEMMDDYPEARKFYMERSWQRRSEFRRRMRKFYEQLEREQIVNKFAAKGKPAPQSDEDSEHYGQEEDSAFE
jgi:hypothetical protein